jgi:hypothetical protein
MSLKSEIIQLLFQEYMVLKAVFPPPRIHIIKERKK